MRFIHSLVQVDPGQAVVIELDHAANVKVMNDLNFDRYRRGQAHQYHGGTVTRSPAAIRPPRPGRWHITVDLGGSSGHVRAGISVQ